MKTHDRTTLDLTAAARDQEFSEFSSLLELEETQVTQVAGGIKNKNPLPPILD